jgi:hypothetical protein
MRFDVDKIVKNTTEKAFEHRLQSARSKVASLTCPEHGTGVTVSLEGSGNKRTMKINGCCEALRKQALELIRQR